MATKLHFECSECGHTRNANRLFSALKAVADGSEPECPTCGSSEELHLRFDFALGAGGKDSSVIGSYYPDEPVFWENRVRGEHIVFYPFLVITERPRHERGVWLPYWHVIRDGDGRTLKYGQWAPFMDASIYENLLDQARSAGMLE